LLMSYSITIRAIIEEEPVYVKSDHHCAPLVLHLNSNEEVPKPLL
jgi:hypothetical protein